MSFSAKKKYVIIVVISLWVILGLIFFLDKFLKQRNITSWFKYRKDIILRLEDEILKDIYQFNQKCGILIKDLRTGYEIAFNQDMVFPSASLVKIPIMACVYCAYREGKLDLKDKLILKDSDKTAGSGILKYMPGGRTFEIEELLHLMIAYSDNTATNMLIDLLGFDYLNSCFKNLGLRHTNVSRKILDNKSRDRGFENFTTAQDISYILEIIYRGEFLNKDISKKCLEFLKQQKVRDRIPALLPIDVVVAHKTGLEKGICHDAGVIFTKEGDFLICILTAHNFKNAQPAKRFISRVAQRLYLTFNKDE